MYGYFWGLYKNVVRIRVLPCTKLVSIKVIVCAYMDKEVNLQVVERSDTDFQQKELRHQLTLLTKYYHLVKY